MAVCPDTRLILHLLSLKTLWTRTALFWLYALSAVLTLMVILYKITFKTKFKQTFTGHSLLQFVRRCADHYLTSENQQMRLESVKTCSRLLCLALEGPHMHAVETTVADVLGKLLIVGITDPGK